MKKGLVLSVRTGVDKDTNEDVVFVTIGKLPTKSRETGKIFAPLKSETLLCVQGNKVKSTAKYNTYKDFKVGDLVELYFGVSSISEKVFVDNIVLVKNSPFTEEEIFGE